MDHILHLLHWDRSEAEQAEGLHMAAQVQSLKGFFQPMGASAGKPVWENCAIALCGRADEDLLPYMTDMLLWLQDLTWPGAKRIQVRLLQFQDADWLALHLRELLAYLLLKKDVIWAQNVAPLCLRPGVLEKPEADALEQLLLTAE